jgi:hypothetical protein
MSSGGKWYLKNDGLDDATILETSGATPFKRGTSLELQPGMRILFGREEHCRVAFFQMLQTT